MLEKQTEEEAQKHADKFRRTTLKELGNNLPVLPYQQGKPLEKRSFSFFEWDMEMEEKVSDIKKKSKTTGDFVSGVLATLVSDICGYDFAEMKDPEKKLMLHQLEFPNIMYLWVALRYEEVGEDLTLDVTCPACMKMNKEFQCDIGDMEISVKDAEHNRDFEYELKKPIVIGDHTITGLKVDVSKWSALDGKESDIMSNAAKLKKSIFESSIVSCLSADGPIEGFVDMDQVIRKLKKRDMEKLMRETLLNNGGPELVIGGKCVHCDAEWVKPLDWSYEYFFDSSSL